MDTQVASLSEDGLLIYLCPGCNEYHGLPVRGPRQPGGPHWAWNGSLTHPTVTPSVLSLGFVDVPKCHHWLRDGKAEFLGDCEHSMRGKTLQLPPFD